MVHHIKIATAFLAYLREFEKLLNDANLNPSKVANEEYCSYIKYLQWDIDRILKFLHINHKNRLRFNEFAVEYYRY